MLLGFRALGEETLGEAAAVWVRGKNQLAEAAVRIAAAAARETPAAVARARYTLRTEDRKLVLRRLHTLVPLGNSIRLQCKCYHR